MADPVWEILVYEIDGTPMGPVREYSELSARIPLSGVPTMSFKVPHTDLLFEDMRASDFLVGLWRTYNPGTGDAVRDLLFMGGVVSAEDAASASGVTLAVSAAGPAYRLDHLLFEQGVVYFDSAVTGELTADIYDVSLNRETILDRLCKMMRGQAINKDFFGSGDTLYPPWVIKDEDSVGTAGGAVTLRPDDGATLWDVWKQAAGGVNGIDWTVDPIAPETGNVQYYSTFPSPTTETHDVTYIGQMRAASTITAVRDNAVFEFGTGKLNVAEYSRAKDWSTMATEVVGSTGVLGRSTTTPSYEHAGAWQAYLNTDELGQSAVVSDILEEHVNIRTHPREVYTLTPAPSGPRYLIDFDLGDQVPFRAKVEGIDLFSGYVRVHGVEVSVDVNGKTVAKPLTVWEDA